MISRKVNLHQLLGLDYGTLLQDNYYIFDYYTPVVEQLGQSFNLDFKRKFLNKKEILQMRKLV